MIYFYGHTPNKSKFKAYTFSNFFPSKFKDPELPTAKFTCAEQYIMFSKARLMGDEKTAELILQQSDPAKIKSLGRVVKNYSEEVWAKARAEVAKRAIYLKFSQNADLKQILLDTGEEELVEAAANDKIWGIGVGMNEATRSDFEKKDWQGENLLGQTLMIVREMLRKE